MHEGDHNILEDEHDHPYHQHPHPHTHGHDHGHPHAEAARPQPSRIIAGAIVAAAVLLFLAWRLL
jgi:hypothetical protein